METIVLLLLAIILGIIVMLAVWQMGKGLF